MIALNSISKIFNKDKSNECYALNKVELTINDGELVAIIGESGSGKSTLLHLIAGIFLPTSGKIMIDNSDITKYSINDMADYRNQKIGIILQEFFLLNDISCIENVLLPTYLKKGNKAENKKNAIKLLYGVNLKDKINEDVGKLSGGEKQRVAVARAIVNDPKIILADEPTGSLDSKNSKEIIDMLKRINERGKTVIIVTHEKQIAEQCGRIVTLSDGKIINNSMNKDYKPIENQI